MPEQVSSTIPLARLHETGLEAMRSGHYDVALSRFQSILERDPENVQARSNWGAIALRLGRIDEAESAFRETIRKAPHWGPGHFNLGLALRRKQKSQDAIKEFRIALEHSMDPASCWRHIAEESTLIGEQTGAINAWRKLLEKEPGNVDALHVLGLLVNPEEGTELLYRARAVAISVLPKSPGSLELLRRLALSACDVAARSGQHDLAEARATEALLLGEPLEGVFRLFLELSVPCDRLIEQALELPSALNSGATGYASASAIMPRTIQPAAASERFWLELALKAASIAPPSNIETKQAEGSDSERGSRLAEACYRRCTEEYPSSWLAWNNWGSWCRERGEPESAIRCLSAAARLSPQTHAIFFNLGMAHADLARPVEAIQNYQRASQLDLTHAETWFQLGLVQQNWGDSIEAGKSYQEALKLRPLHSETWNNLGSVLIRLKRFHEAVRAYRRSLDINPRSIETWINLGVASRKMGNHSLARSAFQQAIGLASVPPFRPDLEGAAWSNLASIDTAEGLVQEALDKFEQAIQIAPSSMEPVQSRLFSLNYSPDLTPEYVYREHRSWGETIEKGIAPYIHQGKKERPRRIGYLSPDLCQHAVSHFIEPLLAHHDREQFEIFAYAEVPAEDAVSKRLRGYFHQWVKTCGQSDRELAEQIHKDGIDILVDLGGLTAHNRVTVMALQPAPVQMTYLGYGATTGLSRVDFRITDDVCDPFGAEAVHSEQLLRVPGGSFCYRPPEDAPEVVRSGRPEFPVRGEETTFTFGAFHHLAKINRSVLDCWAEILLACPESQLIIKSRPLVDLIVRERILREFTARRVELDRIQLLALVPGTASHLSLYQQIDLALDPFPYGGATTTCEALWMGVPTLTLCGDRYVGRMTSSIHQLAGVHGFTADSIADYISLARSWFGRREELSALRVGLREKMLRSRLCDGADFAHRMEQTFQNAWDDFKLAR